MKKRWYITREGSVTKHVVTLTGVLCLAAAVLAGADKPSDANWQTFVDATYKVVLRCPAEWTPTPGYDVAPAFGPEHQPPAFVLDAEGGESNTAQQLCKAAGEHVLQPFGTSPTIRPMEVQGQSACLVWPSPDQKRITGGSNDALLVVKSPKPVKIGGEQYSFLGLTADKNYIMPMIRDLKFLAPDAQNAPFLMEIAFEGGESSGTATGWPIVLTVMLKNNSGQVLRFPFSDPTTDYRFSMSHERWGRTVVTGKYQELERQHKTTPSAAEPLTLGPHASYQTKLEISSLYQLQNPGNYTIQGQMKLPTELGAGLVNSNSLTITVIAIQEGETHQHRPGAVQYQSPYGFCISLPENWEGFSVVEERWKGYDPSGGSQVTEGPLVRIRNPEWTENNPRGDIPTMVFTSKQWQSLGTTFIFSAAGVGPNELGRNSKYVFALPSRYNYDMLDGWEEVDNILRGHPLQAPCGKQ